MQRRPPHSCASFASFVSPATPASCATPAAPAGGPPWRNAAQSRPGGRAWLPAGVLALACLATGSHAQGLPAEFEAALARAKVPREAVAVVVQDTQAAPGAGLRISHRASVPMNPASVMKLVTTYAALDILGPAFTWSTPVYADGPVQGGVLQGNLYIKGQGDPKLVLERIWLLLRRLRGAGIASIQGDMVLDRSALEVPEQDPSQFDGEPLRPYNASPDALLLNYKAVVMTFTPQAGSGQALVQWDPPLAGVQMPASVPLSRNADCGDYRGALRADFSDPSRMRFLGSYPLACGEKTWPMAYADPKTYAARALQAMWQDMGGKLQGVVRQGTVPAALLAEKPLLESTSPALAEVIRDINKFSNNVMAQQLFLTLGRVPAAAAPGAASPAATAAGGMVGWPDGSFAASRDMLGRWWKERLAGEDAPVLENGSGLSRNERISAAALARMLQHAYRSPVMAELMSSLPITGVDGTLRRFKTRTSGSAHLKTGSLSNVIARAGYVDAANGRRYVLVALVNHANANTEAMRTAMDVLLETVAQKEN